MLARIIVFVKCIILRRCLPGRRRFCFLGTCSFGVDVGVDVGVGVGVPVGTGGGGAPRRRKMGAKDFASIFLQGSLRPRRVPKAFL